MSDPDFWAFLLVGMPFAFASIALCIVLVMLFYHLWKDV